jgi:hypothetical protein
LKFAQNLNKKNKKKLFLLKNNKKTYSVCSLTRPTAFFTRWAPLCGRHQPPLALRAQPETAQRPASASADRPWPSDADPMVERDDRAEQNPPPHRSRANPSSTFSSPFLCYSRSWRLEKGPSPSTALPPATACSHRGGSYAALPHLPLLLSLPGDTHRSTRRRCGTEDEPAPLWPPCWRVRAPVGARTAVNGSVAVPFALVRVSSSSRCLGLPKRIGIERNKRGHGGGALCR